MSSLFSGLREAIKKYFSSTSPYEESVEEFIKDLQRTLIKSDVNVKIVFEMSNRIKKRALEEKPPQGASRKDWFLKIVYEELVSILGGEEEPEIIPRKRPYVIMLVGLQGSGKTTTAAKLAWYFKTRKLKSGLIAADTYRAGAYDQLKQLSEKVGALFYGDPRERDPVAISLRGVEELKKQGVDVIIIDTAGRHGYGNEADLLEEMRQIASAVKPDEIVMVLDASIGQKASEIAKRFHEATPIGSIVISKMDGTAKGGGALSAVAMTGAKIKFIGTGEEISEIEPFRTKSFVSRILGLGDIEGLLERMRSLEIDKEELEKQAEEMLTKGLNMKLIYKQLMQIRKMGPLSKVLKMIPGFSMSIPDDSELEKIGEEKFDRWIAAINSMTYEELEKPELIEREKSRLRRIAIGSGTRVEDVRELLKYYEGTRRMLKQLKRKKSVLKKLEKEGEGLF